MSLLDDLDAEFSPAPIERPSAWWLVPVMLVVLAGASVAFDLGRE